MDQDFVMLDFHCLTSFHFAQEHIRNRCVEAAVSGQLLMDSTPGSYDGLVVLENTYKTLGIKHLQKVEVCAALEQWFSTLGAEN